ncbi:unnamed protein product, partial [marine sediment metagenome]
YHLGDPAKKELFRDEAIRLLESREVDFRARAMRKMKAC